MQQADAAARTLERSPENASPLCGIPMALKDVLCVDGDRDDRGVADPERLQAAVHRHGGAATLRRRRGVRREDQLRRVRHGHRRRRTPRYGPVGNPWDVERVPGGSSGGSAAAVAAGDGAVLARHATPAARSASRRRCRGVVGFKPTYGRVSRYGLIAFASSLDQIGPFARTVEDCALVYCGDGRPRPARQHVRPARRRRSAGVAASGRRRACASACRASTTRSRASSPACAPRSRRRSKSLEAQGATIVDVSLPTPTTALAVYYIIAPAECSSNLARFDGVRYGLSRRTRPSLTDMYLQTRDAGIRHRGEAPRHARHLRAVERLLRRVLPCRRRRCARSIKRDFDAVFEKCDAIVCPTSPTVAFPIGVTTTTRSRCTCATCSRCRRTLPGCPGSRVPCGFVGRAAGRPAGDRAAAVARTSRLARRARVRAGDRRGAVARARREVATDGSP